MLTADARLFIQPGAWPHVLSHCDVCETLTNISTRERVFWDIGA